jgi:diguanylate cyclase (GGDEF)-like protein/PAS domain S-box-containing protein
MTEKSVSEVCAENEILRARVEEAEETLRAIRSGEVDSLIITGEAGEQIFTLKGADEFYRTLIENMSEGALTLNADHLIIYANGQVAELLKVSLEKVIGSKISTWIAPNNLLAFEELVSHNGEKNNRQELHLVAADGSLVPISFSTSYPILAGMKDSICLLATDLTEINTYKRNEQELSIAAIAFNSYAGIVVADSNRKIIRANDAYTKITGYTFDEIKGTELNVLSSGGQDVGLYTFILEAINKNGLWEGEVWSKRKNGEAFLNFLTINAVKDKNGSISHYVGAAHDITQSNAAKEKIQNLAFYDQLTQLPNRRLLLDRLKVAKITSQRNGQEGAIFFLDLDHFKKVNDSLGHEMGDLLLQQVAKRLTSCVREGDTVARLGGDEFVLMLEGLGEQPIVAAARAEEIARKIIAELNHSYQLSTHEYHITPSIGITLFNQHQADIEALLGEADIAMYQAKQEGRNTLRFFSEEMQDVINTKIATEKDLRKALDGQQFQLYYQIQVDSNLKPFGAEALIRWVHPDRGLVHPIQFIALAEELGLIHAIGIWVLETACAQLRLWQGDVLTRDLELSINVSAKQFHQPNFTAQVKDIVDRQGINPKLLKLEITESILFENIDAAIDCMNNLKEYGIQFALDDFGTGYSSLQYLNRLPLSQLKIDQSFIGNILNGRNLAIVKTIISMSKTLDVGIIAEGVETDEQQQILQNNGCFYYQGYLFGRPVPIDQFEALLRLMAITPSE